MSGAQSFLSEYAPYSEDTYDSDSRSNYNEYGDSFGTWSVGGSALTGTGGTQDIFCPKSFSQLNARIEADMVTAEDAGLVLRVQSTSTNTYYLMTISDGSAASANTVRIYKRVAGAFTQLGSSVTGIGFTRGVQNTFAFQAAGSAISAFMNGAGLASVTDTTISTTGFVGVRTNGAASQVYRSFRWNFS